MWVPEKWGSEMKAISGGYTEMKGNSAGLNQDVGPSSTPKSEVQR